MKLNEAIILMESYKDLRRIITELHGNLFFNRAFSPTTMNVNVEYNHDAAVAIQEVYRELQAVVEMTKRVISDPSVLPQNRNDIYSASGLIKTIEYASRHRMTAARNLPHKDTGYWIRQARANPNQEDSAVVNMFNIIDSLTSLLEDILEFEQDPARQKAEIVTIKKTPSFEVYRLDNYTAARKICNTFNTNFCIGAGPSMFSSYGAERNRDTYAITLLSREVVIVHYGSTSGFLVTSHDNNSDFDSSGRERGGGVSSVLQNFENSGLELKDIEEAMKSFMSNSDVSKIMSMFEKERTSLPRPVDDYDDWEDPLDDFEPDDLLNMFLNPPQGNN